MALMRCNLHAPASKPRAPLHAVQPVGFPSTALVCGAPKCNASAHIWLDGKEKKAYGEGQRVFVGEAKSVKVRAR